MKKLLQFLSALLIFSLIYGNALATNYKKEISQKQKNMIDTVLEKKIFSIYSDKKLEALHDKLGRVKLDQFKNSPQTYILVKYLISSFNSKYVKKQEKIVKQQKENNLSELLTAMNKVRRENGKKGIVINENLSKIAKKHLDNMLNNGFYGHNLPDGTTFAERIMKSGYTGSSAGENLARGTDSVKQVMNSWMKSPGHRKNILSERYTEVGLAYRDNYWVQIFGSGER